MVTADSKWFDEVDREQVLPSLSLWRPGAFDTANRTHDCQRGWPRTSRVRARIHGLPPGL